MFNHGHGKMKEFLKKFKMSTENQGEKFVVTFEGTKEDVMKMEEKYKAMKTLCCDDECCLS